MSERNLKEQRLWKTVLRKKKVGFGDIYTIFANKRFVIVTDDEERLREELKDLIDDNPIEESEGEDSDGSGVRNGNTRMKNTMTAWKMKIMILLKKTWELKWRGG